MPPKRKRSSGATDDGAPPSAPSRSPSPPPPSPPPPPPAKRAARRSAARSAAVAATAEDNGRPKRGKAAAAAAPQRKTTISTPTTTTAKPEASAGDRGNPEGEGRSSYWLMKAEPESRVEKGKDVKFSIDDLAASKEPQGWDGVRNYGARNNLKAMKVGDLAFFYHSNCKQPGIVGIMEIVREASIDETAFDPDEPYYDPRSSRTEPKWFLVHVSFRRKLRRPIGLQELKKHAGGELREMPLLKQGRLSVSAVPKSCWDFVLELEKQDGEKEK